MVMAADQTKLEFHLSDKNHVQHETIVTTQRYIDGKLLPASNGGTYALHNPARPSELVGHAAAATVDDVGAAGWFA